MHLDSLDVWGIWDVETLETAHSLCCSKCQNKEICLSIKLIYRPRCEQFKVGTLFLLCHMFSLLWAGHTLVLERICSVCPLLHQPAISGLLVMGATGHCLIWWTYIKNKENFSAHISGTKMFKSVSNSTVEVHYSPHQTTKYFRDVRVISSRFWDCDTQFSIAEGAQSSNAAPQDPNHQCQTHWAWVL